MSSYSAATNCARAASATCAGSAFSIMTMPCSNWLRRGSMQALLYNAAERSPRRACSLVPVVAPRVLRGARAELRAGLGFMQETQQLCGQFLDVRGLEIPDGNAPDPRLSRPTGQLDMLFSHH